MDVEEMRGRLASARIGRLATAGPGGLPHLVPFCFAFSADRIVSVVDGKPKRTTELRRLANIRADPRVEVLVDHYEEDWSRIWWIRVKGTAEVLEPGGQREAAIDRLVEKYEQYRSERPRGAVLSILPERWVAWSGGIVPGRP